MTCARQQRLMSGVLAVLLVMVVAGRAQVVAQEGTPIASPAAVMAHPAHIHEGTCDSLNPAPAYPLEDVRLPEGGAPSPAPTGRMAERHEVEASTTVVPVSLDDLLAAPHAD